MILGIAMLLCILLTCVLWKMERTAIALFSKGKVEWEHKYHCGVRRGLSVVGTIVFTVFFLLANTFSYYHHLDNIESIERNKSVVTIYQSKADTLTKQFVKYLMNYSDFEKDIYSKISPQDVDIYMVKYPELKSSTTVIALVDNIYKLQDDVYSTEIGTEDHRKQLRVRKRNPFILTSLLPSE